MSFESIKDVQEVISNLVASKIDSGQIVNMHWATTEVLNSYPQIHGVDADFYIITARHYVSDQVKKCIKSFDPSIERIGGQLVLDGFGFLQKAYPIGSGDDRAIVPIDQISDIELENRAREYEKMAEGCMAHAAEIRQYIRLRANHKTA